MGKKRDDEELIRDGDSCVVYTANSELEAEIIEDALREESIPVMIVSNEDGALDGVFRQQRGWGQVVVLEKDRARAEAIIADLEEELREQAEAAELDEDEGFEGPEDDEEDEDK
jgi:hypothetical protein